MVSADTETRSRRASGLHLRDPHAGMIGSASASRSRLHPHSRHRWPTTAMFCLPDGMYLPSAASRRRNAGVVGASGSDAWKTRCSGNMTASFTGAGPASVRSVGEGDGERARRPPVGELSPGRWQRHRICRSASRPPQPGAVVQGRAGAIPRGTGATRSRRRAWRGPTPCGTSGLR